jgi:AcrR family transcriptional regulator
MCDVKSTPAKRSYVRKDEAMSNLITAAYELLHEKSPDDITIRDVAERANCHHRYIPDYFGGKLPLMIAVLPLARDALLGKLQQLDFEGFPSPELVRFINLLGWLMRNGDQETRSPFTGELFESVTKMYQDIYGFDSEMAGLLAKRLIGSVITMVLMPQAIWMEDGNAKDFFELEQRMMLALAKDLDAEKRR